MPSTARARWVTCASGAAATGANSITADEPGPARPRRAGLRGGAAPTPARAQAGWPERPRSRGCRRRGARSHRQADRARTGAGAASRRCAAELPQPAVREDPASAAGRPWARWAAARTASTDGQRTGCHGDGQQRLKGARPMASRRQSLPAGPSISAGPAAAWSSRPARWAALRCRARRRCCRGRCCGMAPTKTGTLLRIPRMGQHGHVRHRREDQAVQSLRLEGVGVQLLQRRGVRSSGPTA